MDLAAIEARLREADGPHLDDIPGRTDRSPDYPAMARVVAEMMERELSVLSQSGFWGRATARLTTERDALRAEVARLRAVVEDLAPSVSVGGLAVETGQPFYCHHCDDWKPGVHPGH